MEKHNFFSDKFAKKTTDELRKITVSSSHQEAAKLAAIWELERREGVSEELATIAEDIQTQTDQKKEENRVTLKYQTSGPRFLAALIDWGLMVVIVLLINLIPMVSWIQSLINALLIILPYGYSVLMHAYYGQTVGKILMSVKVVTYSSESDIGIGQALLRDIGPLIYIAVLYLNLLFLAIHGAGASPIIAVVVLVLQVIYWLWGLIEIVTMLFDDKSRSLPDYIAGTIVVRE